MPDYSLAANFIEQFEGYQPVAKWDVNAYRLGYGSSTEGPDQVKVTKGMVTTRERAFENLEARIPAFNQTIVEQVGATAWGKLQPQAQAALLSMAYNYGDLPSDVANAVRVGDSLPHIASAVEAHEGDNGGVNKSRRLKEAAYIIMAKVAKPAPALVEPPSTQAPTKPTSLVEDIVNDVADELKKPAPDATVPPLNVAMPADIQKALNILVPAEPLAVDGTYGPETVAKMKAFQASRGLKPTGDASFNSILALREALQEAGVPVVNPT